MIVFKKLGPEHFIAPQEVWAACVANYFGGHIEKIFWMHWLEYDF